jgi:hypothetical protein
MCKAFARAVLLIACLMAATLLFASPAFAAPAVNWVRAGTPIAYDLKSFQSTRFTASVNTANVWAVLKVKTGRGDVVVYKGSIPTANTTFTFPKWNGMGPDGRRLPPASYNYELTISKGGASATASGKILISNVYFGFSGHTYPDVIARCDGYLKARATNVYLTATTPVSEVGGGRWLGFGIKGPGDPDTNDFGVQVSLEHPVKRVDRFVADATGVWRFSAGGSDVDFVVTVIQ